MKQTIAALIVFYNKLEQTIECIESLIDSKINIYVLNNGSDSMFRKQLGDFCVNFQQIKIIDSPINLGPSVGRNILIEESDEDWLLFLDNDITVKSKNWLDIFNAHIKNVSDVEIFIPETFNKHENRYVPKLSMSISHSNKIFFSPITSDNTNFFPGGASIINRGLFDRLGIYDGEIFVGFEDFEMAIRALRLGNPIKAKLIHDIELVHDHRYLSSEKDHEAAKTRYDYNHINDAHEIVFKKHGVIIGRDFGPWLIDQISQITKKK